MFTFRSARPAMWVLVALLTVAAGLVACDVAIAADLATAPGAKNSESAGTLKIKPDKHHFGEVIVPLTSPPQTITVNNDSKSASIGFTSIVATPPFTIQTDGCSGAPLAAGNACHVVVVFHPTATGQVTNKKGLTFTDSARKSPQYVELSGQGIVGATPTATATPTTTPTPTPTKTLAATPTITPTPKPAFSGHVMGGTANPVANSSVAVWAPGTTGYGTGATQFPGTASATADDGSFYSGIFACASDTQIYATAQGGDAGEGVNSSLTMMAAVGACDTIGFGVKSFVVNEVTTAGSVYALAQFLSTTTSGIVGAPASDAAGLASAFATLANLVDPTTGTARSGAPQETLNSIANALAACVQTDGASSPVCTELFDCALPGAVFSAGACSGGSGSVTDTLEAALSIALYPADVSVDGIYDVSTKAAAYSPALTSAPPDWSLP